MEAVMFNRSPDKTNLYQHKSHLRNSNRITHPSVLRPSNNFVYSGFHTMGGLLQAPPQPNFHSHSYPPFQQVQPPLQQVQPPLLPLPSCPQIINRRSPRTNNGGNSNSTNNKTPKKSKINSPTKKSISTTSLPKQMPLISSSGNNIIVGNDGNNGVISTNYRSGSSVVEDEIFSGSVVLSISPPPSSLPLPTFNLRPKLMMSCCKAGIDTGATDNLRRLLRIS